LSKTILIGLDLTMELQLFDTVTLIAISVRKVALPLGDSFVISAERTHSHLTEHSVLHSYILQAFIWRKVSSARVPWRQPRLSTAFSVPRLEGT
jgi:hypothetical protein